MANFETEIKTIFDTEYLKVFVKDESVIANIRDFLECLQSVKKANVTNNRIVDITIYPQRLFDIEETQVEVTVALNNYFEGKNLDPIFEDEGFSSISGKAYYQILNRIISYGRNLEKYKKLYDMFNEEGFRDFFLPHLNSISNNHIATGETFNKKGKTDILIQNQKGENIFVAECKIWSGEEGIEKAINQLFDKYVTWRDERVALIIFNKAVKNFTDIIEKAKNRVSAHRLCGKFVEKRTETSYSYIFKHSDDVKKNICLELILFNCS